MHDHPPQRPSQRPPNSEAADEPGRPTIPRPGQDGGREHEPTPPELHLRIWVGSLADYNSGRLHGAWLHAATDEDTLRAGVRAVLASSHELGAEERGIFDHDGFGVWKPGESEQLSIVSRVACGIAEHGPAFAAWADLHDADDDALAQFSDAYLGEYESAKDWADTIMDDLGWRQQIDDLVSEDLARYIHIDTDARARDAWFSGDVLIVHKPNGGVWIFDGRI